MGILDKFRLDGKLAWSRDLQPGLAPPSRSRWLRPEPRSHATAIAALRRKRANRFVRWDAHRKVSPPTLANRTARTRCIKRCWQPWAHRM